MKANISDINPVNIHFQTQTSEVMDKVRSNVEHEELGVPLTYGDNFENKDMPAAYFTPGSRTRVNRAITYEPRSMTLPYTSDATKDAGNPEGRGLQKHELDQLNSDLKKYRDLDPSRKKEVIDLVKQEFFSMGVQPRVQEVIEAIAHDLTDSLNNKVEKFIVETILDKLSIGIDTEFSEYIAACKESNSISNLFEKLSIEHSSELVGLQQDLSNFSKLSRVQTSSDSFHHLQISIVRRLVEVKDLYSTLCIEGVKIEHVGSTLLIEGFAPKISQVLSTLSDHVKDNKNVTSIEVIGGYKVEIDVDLPKDKMSGKNLSIIANIWEIKGQRTIDLSGLDCDYTYYQAADGMDGNPGKPGKSGGHFWGYGNHFIGIENLKICSDGGKGGDGQQGGKGIAGANKSGNTTVRDDKVKNGNLYENIDPYTQDDNYYDDDVTTTRVATFKRDYAYSSYNLHRQVYRPTPPTPNHGGNGGDGGAPGKAGLPGKIELIGYQGEVGFASNPINGQAGRGGEGGQGGQVPVYEVDYLYRTPGVWTATISMGYGSASRIRYWIENRHVNTFYGNSGSSGRDGRNDSGISDPETIDQIKLISVTNRVKEKLESLAASRELGMLEKLVTNFQESLSTNEKLQEKLYQHYLPELQKYTTFENQKILKIISSYV
jgi:hypothetical protein